MNRFTYSIAAILLAFGLVACTGNREGDQRAAATGQEQQQPGAAAGDQDRQGMPQADRDAGMGGDVVETLVHVNHKEMELAQLAQDRAQNPQVKQFAQRVLRDHQQSHEKMQSIAQERGITAPQEEQIAQQERERLQDLKGKEFDREFVSLMIKEHENAEQQLQQQSEQAQGQEQQLAQQNLQTIRQHLEQARQLEQQLGGNNGSDSSRPATERKGERPQGGQQQ